MFRMTVGGGATFRMTETKAGTTSSHHPNPLPEGEGTQHTNDEYEHRHTLRIASLSVFPDCAHVVRQAHHERRGKSFDELRKRGIEGIRVRRSILRQRGGSEPHGRYYVKRTLRIETAMKTTTMKIVN